MSRKNTNGPEQTRHLLELYHWREVYLLTTPCIALAKHMSKSEDIYHYHGIILQLNCGGVRHYRARLLLHVKLSIKPIIRLIKVK